jgi:hypothetical protein
MSLSNFFRFYCVVCTEDGVLLMCFSDLRQLLDLFVSWDWATYFADFGKSDNSKYNRLVAPIAAGQSPVFESLHFPLLA